MSAEKTKILFNTLPTSFWDAATKNTASILTAFVAILTLLASASVSLSVWGNLNIKAICILCIALWSCFFILLIITVFTALKSPKKMLQNSITIMFESVLGDNVTGENYTSTSPIEKSTVKLKLGKGKTEIE